MPLAPLIDVLEEDLAEFGDAWLYFIRRAHQGDCRNGLACQVMDRRPERVAGTGQPDVLGDSGFPDGVELVEKGLDQLGIDAVATLSLIHI